MSGQVVGGWGFVWAAYALTGAAFVIYGAVLVARIRGEISREKREGESR